jgi:hypothetical protein
MHALLLVQRGWSLNKSYLITLEYSHHDIRFTKMIYSTYLLEANYLALAEQMARARAAERTKGIIMIQELEKVRF